MMHITGNANIPTAIASSRSASALAMPTHRTRSCWRHSSFNCPNSVRAKANSFLPATGHSWTKCQALTIDNVRSVENGDLPKANIGLWKVAKIFHFLATFQVHPRIDLTFHDPVAQRIDWPGKLVHEPIGGSQRLMSDHRNPPQPYTLNHWVVGSIPTRCKALT
jgi:hypothetical protein